MNYDIFYNFCLYSYFNDQKNPLVSNMYVQENPDDT